MDNLLLNEDTLELVIGNDEIRQLLPCVDLHPKDLIDRAQEEGCSGCSGARKRQKAGRMKQLALIVEDIAECLAKSGYKAEVKEILGLKNLTVYYQGQRLVL